MRHLLTILAIILVMGCGKEKKPSSWDYDDSQIKETIAKADQLWESGQKADAVDEYTSAMYGEHGARYFHMENRGEAPRIYRRVIDYKIEVGGLEAARDDIEDALKTKITLSLSTPEANEFVAKVREERDQGNREAAERMDARRATGGRSTSGSHKQVDVTLITKLRPGMTEDQVVAILGQPHDVSDVTLDAIPEFNQSKRVISTWTYNPDSNSFMVLVFENGILGEGQSGGYDIKKGILIPKEFNDLLREAKE